MTKGRQRHKNESEDEGCITRMENLPLDGGREIIHEGEIYYMVDNSSDGNRTQAGGEAHQVVDGPGGGETKHRNETSEDQASLALRQEDNVNKSVSGKVPEYASDDPLTREVHAAGVVPHGLRHQPSSGADTTEGTDQRSQNHLPPSTRHPGDHHRRWASATDAIAQRSRRRHQGHRRRHHRRHKGRSLTSRDEDVEVKTTYTSGRNNRQRYHRNNNTKFDAYSYTIILTDGE